MNVCNVSCTVCHYSTDFGISFLRRTYHEKGIFPHYCATCAEILSINVYQKNGRTCPQCEGQELSLLGASMSGDLYRQSSKEYEQVQYCRTIKNRIIRWFFKCNNNLRVGQSVIEQCNVNYYTNEEITEDNKYTIALRHTGSYVQDYRDIKIMDGVFISRYDFLNLPYIISAYMFGEEYRIFRRMGYPCPKCHQPKLKYEQLSMCLD
jgi:hypothetical protein